MGLCPAAWQLPRTTYSLVDTLVAMIYDKHVLACTCKAGQLTVRYLRNHWVKLQQEMPDGEAGNYIQRIKDQVNDPEVKYIFQEGTQHHAGHTNAGRESGSGARSSAQSSGQARQGDGAQPVGQTDAREGVTV